MDRDVLKLNEVTVRFKYGLSVHAMHNAFLVQVTHDLNVFQRGMAL